MNGIKLKRIKKQQQQQRERKKIDGFSYSPITISRYGMHTFYMGKVYPKCNISMAC